jgi:hypothetical protein
MRKSLETLRGSQARLEAEIMNARNENAGLQSQIQVQEVKAQRPQPHARR